MFILNGTVNGETYTDQEMGGERIAEIFGIDIPFDSKRGQLAFELHESQKKVDRWNGGMSYQSGKMLRSEISGSYNGDNVHIQYYRTKNRKRINGESIINYQPHHLLYDGDSFAFSLDRKEYPADMEPMIFFWLNPRCENSPITGRSQIKYYKINDSLAKAKDKLAEKTRMFHVWQQVVNENVDMHLLRNKAAGMNIQEHAMEDEEVRAALLERAELDIESFWKVFDTHQTSFEGLVQRGLELGIIVLRALGGGVSAYGFNPEISQQYHQVPFQEISQHLAGQDGKANLKVAMSESPGLVDELNRHVEQYGMNKAVATKFNENSFSSSKGKPAKPVVADAEEDEYMVAAEWAVKNKLVSFKKDNIIFKHNATTTFDLGTINPGENLTEALAVILTEKSAAKALASIQEKMNG